MSASVLPTRRQLLGQLGAAATWAFAPAPRAAAAADIYQRIWDADQSASGIPAIPASETGDPSRGFVKVDEDGSAGADHRLFVEVQIPAT
jgi:hypothetical protein